MVHVQSAQALAFSRFIRRPTVLTLLGPHEPKLTDFYNYYPDTYYVCISDAQRTKESMPRMRTIRHGTNPAQYRLVEHKQHYLSFIGRIVQSRALTWPSKLPSVPGSL